MKILYAVLPTLVVCQAAVLVRVPGPDDPGISVQYQNQDGVGNYDFGYDESHLSGGTFRKETGDTFGNKIGSYGLRDADGRLRVVNYVADANGFRANVKSNEPGLAPQDPASTIISKVPGVVAVPPAPVPPISPLAVLPAPAVVPPPPKVALVGPPPPAAFNYAIPAPPSIPYAAPVPNSSPLAKYPGTIAPFLGVLGAPYYGNPMYPPQGYPVPPPQYDPLSLVASYRSPVPFPYPKGPAALAYPSLPYNL